MALSQQVPPSEVRYEVSNHIARLTISRESKRNALSFATTDLLLDRLQQADEDRDIRVIVLAGAGSLAFCAGADLAELREGGHDPESAHAGRGNLASVITQMYRLCKPTIARVQGYALAGGFGLALACDYVVASEHATFGAPEVNVGLWPYMITVPLLRSMRPKDALDLILTGRRVTASEGREFGFVSRLTSASDLDSTVEELATLLASRSPGAVRLGRPAFYRALEQTSAQALPELQAMLSVATTTPDAAEGAAAFREKRQPVWPD
ncbi:enoyl-CoA hydratase-related protein [Acidothermaceae bacterium B102]|nr:enoyl-CoA hydratase-related protein [Acidothermaceae bacterium B102]